MLKSNKRIISLITAVSIGAGTVGIQEIKALEGQKSENIAGESKTESIISEENEALLVDSSATTSSAVTIKEARNLENGTKALVYGVVTYVNGKSIYFQDETGAINAYSSTSVKLNKGDYVKVSGQRSVFKNMVQLDKSEIEKVETREIPDPKVITIDEANTDQYQAQYIRIEDAVVDVSKKTLTQGEDVLKVDTIPSSFGLKNGDRVNVTGVMGRYDENIQLYGKSSVFEKIEDIIEAINIEHTPETKMNKRKELKISAKIKDDNADTVILKYKASGSSEYSEVEMSSCGEGVYEAVIPSDIALGTMEYSIHAENKYGSKVENYKTEIIDADSAAPEIYDITPEANSNVGDEARPVISAKFKDETGVDTNSVKIYINGEDVTSKATIDENSVSYIPSKDLENGKLYKVKITAADKNGNEGSKEWSFKKGTVNYQHLTGQLHSHTDISDGKGTLSEAYEWAKNQGKADYFAVTDHSNWFENDTAANIGDGSASPEWMNALKTADKYNEDPDFTAIYGYEMTWSGSTGGWGHMNTFNTPGFETRTNTVMRDIVKYYDALETQPQSISQFNHPGKTFGDFADFAYYSKKRDELINMVEVGNGEGAVRSSGYFPSYEYYTRALDKGWHLAPTNNQDNHKANWITANDARTIVIAQDNSRDAIYDAMRAKRVYASEDKNLNIDFTVNGEQMGTELGNVDSLDFKVNVVDTDSSDKIKMVSVIANGGIEVVSKQFNSNTAEWNFTLNPEYSYYYVKVVQEDGDIAVTAPVWVGESLNVGLQPMTCENSLIVSGNETKLTTGIYNNTEDALSDINVNFYENSISDDKIIGSVSVDSIDSGEEKEVSYGWKPKKSGEYTVYAVAKIKINGQEKTFTSSIKLKAVNKEDTFKVVIDGAHDNQYTTGDYAGKYTALKSMLEGKNTVTELNTEPITYETLEGASILILTNPQSTNYNEFKASTFSDEEVSAIKRFVDNGGNLIMSTRADFKDGTGEYSNGNQMNKVLKAIGTEIRVNDDEVVDYTKNGGQEYRLYLEKYNSDKYNLTKGVSDGEQYSFYNGASVILAENASGENVDFLVKGHETTEAIDADNAGDNVPVDKGNVSVLAAEKLQGGGKVVVSGNTFFSDFEIDGSNGEKYSNVKVTENIIDWMLPEKEINVVSISHIRKDENNDGVPDLLGQEYTIEGYVTSQSEAVAPKNSFFEVVYIEDETGGLCIFGISNTELKVGQKIRVTGKVDEYQGEFELQIDDESTQLEIIDENIKEIKPLTVSTKDSMLPENGGKLVKVQGKVVDMNEQNLYIDDGTGISRAYVEGYIWDGVNEETKGRWDSSIKVGDTVSAIGLASMDPEGARLRVRNTGEIEKVVIEDSNSNNTSDSANSSGTTSSSSSSSSSHSSSSSSSDTQNNESTSNTDSVANSNSDSITAENGAWVKDGENWTFVDESGNKKTGWLQDTNGQWYHLDESGIMQTGWVKDNDGEWYYMSQSGSMQTGWVKDNDGKWYYMNQSGSMQTGWVKDNDGKWYYMNRSGSMETGWVKDNNGKWYYMNQSGAMQTGWVKDNNGKWYYLTESGSMAVNTTIDGYRVDETGCWIQ